VYVVAIPLLVEFGETDPQELPEHETVHLTPPGLTSFTTVAVNDCAVLSKTVALVVSRERLTGGGGGGVADAPPHAKVAASNIAAVNTPRSRA
jgi:hypothetical protein